MTLILVWLNYENPNNIQGKLFCKMNISHKFLSQVSSLFTNLYAKKACQCWSFVFLVYSWNMFHEKNSHIHCLCSFKDLIILNAQILLDIWTITWIYMKFTPLCATNIKSINYIELINCSFVAFIKSYRDYTKKCNYSRNLSSYIYILHHATK